MFVDQARSNLCLGLLTLAVGSAVVTHGGDGLFDSNLALLVVGLAAVLGSFSVLPAGPPPPWTRFFHVAALLFPAYVAFQLVPLPLAVLRVVSPTRAEVADALRIVMAAPQLASLTIAPATTWVQLSRVTGYALIFLLVLQIARHGPKNIWAPAVPLIVMGTLEAVWAFSQGSDAAVPFAGSYYNKNHFAGLLEMVLPFAVMYGIAVLHGGTRRLVFPAADAIKASALLASALAMLVAIVLSLSKGGVLSMLGSLLLMGVLGVGGRLSGWRRWSLLAGLGLLVVTVFVFLTPAALVEQFGVVTTSDPTEGRLPIWRDALHLVGAYPLFGTGLGTFYPGLLRYQTVGLGFAWTAAHNDYLQLLSELGFVGVLVPVALMGGAFAVAVRAALAGATRETRYFGIACAGGLAAILIHSFSDFNTYVLANAMVLSWIAGLSASLSCSVSREPHAETGIASSRVGNTGIALGGLLAIHALGWMVFLERFQHDPAAERLSCRFGVCDTDAALATLRGLPENTARSGVAPDDILEYLRRDPAAPYRWGEMGEALRTAGRPDEARQAFSRAVALAPHFPPTLLMAAGFHFDVGEDREALDLTSHGLEAGAGFDEGVFVDFDQRHIPVDDILRYGLPDRRSSQAYLRQLMTDDRLENAGPAWTSMLSRGQVDDKLANEYLEFLFRNKKPEVAAEAWAAYSARQATGHLDSRWPFNGGFESNPTGSRFDWKLDASPGAAIDFDRDAKHSGGRSLRIQFDGTANPGNIGVQQAIFLQPGRYRFRAYVRTRDISTDRGVHFRVVSDDNPKELDVQTDDLQGSTDWTLAERVFDAPPGGGLVRVILAREPSLKFDNKLSGTLWVDDVSLTKVQ